MKSPRCKSAIMPYLYPRAKLQHRVGGRIAMGAPKLDAIESRFDRSAQFAQTLRGVYTILMSGA